MFHKARPLARWVFNQATRETHEPEGEGLLGYVEVDRVASRLKEVASQSRGWLRQGLSNVGDEAQRMMSACVPERTTGVALQAMASRAGRWTSFN